MPCSIEPIDVDEDGDIDLVVLATDTDSGDAVCVLLNENGTLCMDSMLSVVADPTDMDSGDFDDDGDVDLAITGIGSDELQILENDGAGVFSIAATYSTGDKPIACRSSIGTTMPWRTSLWSTRTTTRCTSTRTVRSARWASAYGPRSRRPMGRSGFRPVRSTTPVTSRTTSWWRAAWGRSPTITTRVEPGPDRGPRRQHDHRRHLRARSRSR